MNQYERWAASPEGQAQIQRGMDKAKADVDAFIARRKSDEERAFNAWCVESQHRAAESNLHSRLGKYSGRIDDTYTAEVPLTLGWNQHEDGVSLAYVSLGGVDVTEYLPPDVLADIRSHIELSDEPEAA
jgi:hypothetical protein